MLEVENRMSEAGGTGAVWLSGKALRIAFAFGIAIAIFAADTFSPLKIAIAVFYVVVVLLAADVFRVPGIVVTAIICLALTLLSYLIEHGFEEPGGSFVRAVVSLSAISVTTLLAVRNRAAALALSERSYLLEQTHDAIFVRDMNDTITYWNRGSEDLYGWLRELAVGRQSHDLLQTRFPEPLDEIRDHLLRTGRWEGRLVHTDKSGVTLVVSSRWVLNRDANGRPTSILETNTDITERSRVQEQLHEAQVSLEHAARLSTLGELTASIAHEVNQPLAAIVANGEAGLRWLKRPVPGLDEARVSIERVIADGRRASQVIANLRRLAKKGEETRQPISLNEVVEEVLLLLQQQLSSLSVTVERDLEASLSLLSADRVQMQQVVMNLILNGAQAVAAAEAGDRNLVVRTRTDGESNVFEVGDSGPGITPEIMDRLFMPFFTTKPEGMGMGLSICRTIIEVHEGRIWAESEPGHGATFRFSLPGIG
ncbi:MAG TPA: ATP-binding protein [Terriglobales bacterium]|nr:ATP-binding protein [Terriglobales bacterium]